MRWLDGITDSMYMSWSELLELVHIKIFSFLSWGRGHTTPLPYARNFSNPALVGPSSHGRRNTWPQSQAAPSRTDLCPAVLELGSLARVSLGLLISSSF